MFVQNNNQMKKRSVLLYVLFPQMYAFNKDQLV